MQQVENCITANSKALTDGLEVIPGLEVERSFDPHRVSGIVAFRMPGKKPAELHSALKDRNVTCAVRGDAIRLSPHFYQAGHPVQEMLAVIEDSI